MIHYLRLAKLLFVRKLCNFWIKIICGLDNNIQIGKNCNFTGLTYFRPLPGSKIKIGSNCTFNSLTNSNLIGINRNCMISTLQKGAEIIIEDECGFSGTVIGAFAKITIKNGVKCGSNTLITDSDWHLDDSRANESAPVEIGKNVWLGEGVKVLKGVTIGDNSVIGAGSVVTKDIQPNVIAAGNPCKVIKKI